MASVVDRLDQSALQQHDPQLTILETFWNFAIAVSQLYMFLKLVFDKEFCRFTTSLLQYIVLKFHC